MIERGVFGIGNPLLDILAKVAPGMCILKYDSYCMTGFNLQWYLVTSNDPKLKEVNYRQNKFFQMVVL